MAQFFGIAALLFAGEAPLLRGAGRFGCLAQFGGFGRGADKLGQTQARIGTIACLGAETLGVDHEYAFLVDAASRQDDKAAFCRFGEGSGMCDIEAQLNGSRNLVDILTAGSRGTYK